jgi:hypothetical protein
VASTIGHVERTVELVRTREAGVLKWDRDEDRGFGLEIE